MGLSSEERISKFYWAAMGWRSRLHDFAQKLGDQRLSWYTREETQAVANGWVSQVDLLVGQVIRAKAGAGSAYWLLGEGDSALRGVLSEPYLLRQEAEPEGYAFMPKHEWESAPWWSDNANHEMTADRLQFSGFLKHEGLNNLGRWWDCYGYLSALTYPIWRYDDDLFPAPVKESFLRLTGEMVNRRFEVCFGTDSESDKTDPPRMEQFLLAKHNAFHALLEKEGRQKKGMDYFKAKFDGYTLYERVAKMSAKDLYVFFEAQRDEKDKRDRKYHADEAAKREANPKVSGLFGPPVPKREDPQPPPKRKGKR